MSRRGTHGLDNQVYVGDGDDDLDRIEVITTSSCSLDSDVQSRGSQRLLADSTDAEASLPFSVGSNISFGRNHGDGGKEESFELTSGHNLLNQRSKIDTLRMEEDFSRGCTPTNMVRRWSQNLCRFNKDKRSMGENTICRLPSRKVVEVDGKLRSATSVNAEAEIEQLVKEIEQHECLMEDTVLAKRNRLETLRALPQPLSTKRLLKRRLSISIEMQASETQTRNWRKRLSNACVFAAIKLLWILHVICNGVEIWYNALKNIEGNFGSNVSSYFKFLRWLLVLNLLLAVCMVSFVTIPQALYSAASGNAASEENEAESVWSEDRNTTVVPSDHLTFLDILTGEGRLQYSLMFYGSYSNATYRTYSLPHGYYMTLLIVYLFIFVVISISMARSYRESFIEASGSKRLLYAHKVFSSWDYGISKLKAAELKHLTIYAELKAVLSEIGESKTQSSIPWRIWVICTQSVAHLLVSAMVVGVGISIWMLLKEFGEIKDISGWSTLYAATVVNFSLLVMQSIFSWISKLEDYHSPRRALHINLVRNFILEAVIAGVLIYYWFTKKYGKCWETTIGQEVYRMLVLDSFISLLLVPVFNAFRVFFLIRFFPKYGRPDFDISQKSLGLVFNQTLVWVGMLFAPLLAVFIVLKMVPMFYVNKVSLLYICKSPRHAWRSGQTQTLYLVFTFLSLLGVIIALGYIMTQVPVSPDCGPFRDYAYMFQIFIDGVLKLRQNRTVWLILMTLIRPAAVGGMLTGLAVMVYYLRAKSRANCMMVKLLKEMVYLEAKDKEFLLASITNITKGREWMLEKGRKQYSLAAAAADDRYAESSATWRYARRNRSNRASTVSAQSMSSALSVGDDSILRSRII